MVSHRERQNRTAFRLLCFALGRHARTSTLPFEMRTTAEAAAPPADRVRKPRSFRRPLALWFTALLFFIAFLGFVTFVVFGTWLLISGRRLHGMIALAGMGIFIVTRGLASMLARALTCHLCHGPMLKEATPQARRCQATASARVSFVGRAQRAVHRRIPLHVLRIGVQAEEVTFTSQPDTSRCSGDKPRTPFCAATGRA